MSDPTSEYVSDETCYIVIIRERKEFLQTTRELFVVKPFSWKGMSKNWEMNFILLRFQNEL